MTYHITRGPFSVVELDVGDDFEFLRLQELLLGFLILLYQNLEPER